MPVSWRAYELALPDQAGDSAPKEAVDATRESIRDFIYRYKRTHLRPTQFGTLLERTPLVLGPVL